MTRLEQERLEQEWLSPYASPAAPPRGRVRQEAPYDTRTDYQRDPHRRLGMQGSARLQGFAAGASATICRVSVSSTILRKTARA